MNVKVLGTGCTKCRKLLVEAEKAIAEAGVDAQLVKVEKLADIAAHGVTMTPALVIDDQVRAAGRIPSAAQIGRWLKDAEATGSR